MPLFGSLCLLLLLFWPLGHSATLRMTVIKPFFKYLLTKGYLCELTQKYKAMYRNMLEIKVSCSS